MTLAASLLLAALLWANLAHWLGSWRFGKVAAEVASKGTPDCGRSRARDLDSEELGCAMEALQQQAPFQLRLEGPFGIDTIGAEALIANPGETPILITLRVPNDKFSYRISKTTCKNPQLMMRLPSAFFQCNS